VTGANISGVPQRRPYSPPTADVRVPPPTKMVDGTRVFGQTAGVREPARTHPEYLDSSSPAVAAQRPDDTAFSASADQRGGQPVYPRVLSPSVFIDQRPFSPSSAAPAAEPVHHPASRNLDSAVDKRIDGRPYTFADETVQGATASVNSSDEQRFDSRPFSPASGTDRALSPASRSFSPSASSSSSHKPSTDQRLDNRALSPTSTAIGTRSGADRALSPSSHLQSPLVSSPSTPQRPSSAPSGGTTGTIKGYRRICFSPVPQSAAPSHRASPIPLMLSDSGPRDPRIAAARTPRRGSDVTASAPPPSYLASGGATRPQLKVLRENQIADWGDSRQPVMWTPVATSAAPPLRSHSLEPVSGYY